MRLQLAFGLGASTRSVFYSWTGAISKPDKLKWMKGKHTVHTENGYAELGQTISRSQERGGPYCNKNIAEFLRDVVVSSFQLNFQLRRLFRRRCICTTMFCPSGALRGFHFILSGRSIGFWDGKVKGWMGCWRDQGIVWGEGGGSCVDYQRQLQAPTAVEHECSKRGILYRLHAKMLTI